MIALLFGVGAVAGVLLVIAVFQLRTESPDNQRRMMTGGLSKPKPTKSFRSLFKQPEPDPCEDSTIVKVQWLANRLAGD